MLKNRLTKQQISALTQQLQSIITTSKDDLKTSIHAATNDSVSDFNHDYQEINDLLTSLREIDFDDVYEGRKPKGKALIILSYNEPLIMCIDPIVSALIAGNDVYVRPSSASSQILHKIWNPACAAIPWLSERLTIIDTNYQTTQNLIPSVQAVYFFGSQHIAKKIGSECSKYLVEFWPETEGSDFAVYTDTAPLTTEEFAQYIYEESFSHSGQMCQRIQGIFVHHSKYEPLKKSLQSIVSNVAPADFNPPNDLQIKMRKDYDILVAKHSTITYTPGERANMPSLVTGIQPDSSVCQNAYFLPSLWLVPYESDETLVTIIANRPIQFGSNIWTSDQLLVDSITMHTRLTRITVNTNHIEIRQGEGWGGSQPTSFGGNMQWSHKFSNQYSVIDK